MAASRAAFINILRDPTARAVSNFYYVNKKTAGGEADLDACMKAVRRVQAKENIKSAYYASIKVPCAEILRRTQLRYFCGYRGECYQGLDAAYAQARRNVEEHYLFVGLLEEYDLSVRSVGLLAFYSHAHVCPAPHSSHAPGVVRQRPHPPLARLFPGNVARRRRRCRPQNLAARR
jgi:hypothetical protein